MRVSVTCRKQTTTVYEVDAKTMEDAVAQVTAMMNTATIPASAKLVTSHMDSMTMTPVAVG